MPRREFLHYCFPCAVASLALALVVAEWRTPGAEPATAEGQQAAAPSPKPLLQPVLPRTTAGKTADAGLVHAARSGNLEDVRSHFASGAPDAERAAIQAAEKGHVDILLFLLARGAVGSKALDQALVASVKDQPQVETLRLLLEKETSRHARNEALAWAVYRYASLHAPRESEEALDLLLRQGADWKSLEKPRANHPLVAMAAHTREKRTAELLEDWVARGMNLNLVVEEDGEGNTLLIEMLRNPAYGKLHADGLGQEVAWLLAHGVDARATNKQGKTALEYATDARVRSLLRTAIRQPGKQSGRH